MATNQDIRVRVLTMRELAELRHDMLDASAWMRAELRYRRMRREPTGFDLFEVGHPNPSPKDTAPKSQTDLCNFACLPTNA